VFNGPPPEVCNPVVERLRVTVAEQAVALRPARVRSALGLTGSPDVRDPAILDWSRWRHRRHTRASYCRRQAIEQ
jgi:hypothetical protein